MIISPESIAKKLLETKKVAIFGHSMPDGDCYGSAFSLKSALDLKGIESYVFFTEGLPPYFDFLKTYNKLDTSDSYVEAQAAVVLDCSDISRVENLKILSKYRENNIPIYVIDHHVLGDMVDFADFIWSDPAVSSTSEMVLEILKKMNVEIHKDIATLLLVGIETDSFSFQNQNTTSATLEAAAYLVSHGARIGQVVRNAFETKTLNIAKIYGLALERLKYNKEFQTVTTYITQKDMSNFQVGEEAISGIANYLNSIDGARIVFLIAENKDDSVKVSLRTRDDKVDLAGFAKIFGGGGHKKASGFEIKGRMKEKDGKMVIVPL